MSVQEMIARRRDVAKQISALQEELQHLDDAICGAFEQVAAMFSAGTTFNGPTHLELRANPAGQFRRRIGPSEEVEISAGDRRRLVPAIVHLLEANPGPVKTRELLEYLKSLGVEVGGKNEMNNLAAHLSSIEMVESTPDGWILRRRRG